MWDEKVLHNQFAEISARKLEDGRGGVKERAGESSKIQTPSSREDPNTKLQSRRADRRLCLANVVDTMIAVLVFGSWCFSGAWILVFGS
jgi:hypothetical protein